MTEWKTSISKFTANESIIRGKNHLDLINNLTFTETIFLLLKEKLPTKEETNMLNAIFVAAIDHGIEVPSIIAARTVLSGGNPINTAVAAGISTLGDFHGGAIEGAASLFEKEIDNNPKNIVKTYLDNKQVIPGFGHKIYEIDPRSKVLFDIAKKNNFFDKYCKFVIEIETELKKSKNKKIPINIDGVIAAIILDMGFDSEFAKAFFIIARTPGICAHVIEERKNEKPFRRLKESEYTGI